MPKPKTSSPKLLVLALSISLLASLTARSFYKLATNKLTEGDILVDQGKYNQGIVKFEEAQKLWPFLAYDQTFQERISRAEKSELTTITLRKNTKETDIEAFTNELKAVVGVREVKYISKEEALNEYREQYKDQPDLVKIVSRTIDFPEQLEVFSSDQSSQDKVVQIAKSKTFVEYASKALQTF